jgi:hypothetical protein
MHFSVAAMCGFSPPMSWLPPDRTWRLLRSASYLCKNKHMNETIPRRNRLFVRLRHPFSQ